MSAGAAFLAAAGSSGLDMFGNSIMANSANAKSKRAVMLQYALANQLMNKQNEYNKPINQMARLREAGLNPNLVYGDGGATIASASGGNPSTPDITPASGTFGIMGKMQALQQMKQSEANISETKARTAAIDENIDLKKEELKERKRYDNARLKILEKQGERIGVQNAKTNAEVQYLSNKPSSTLTGDPVGYFVNQAGNVASVLEDIHDGTLHWLNNTFGKRSNAYIKKRK